MPYKKKCRRLAIDSVPGSLFSPIIPASGQAILTICFAVNDYQYLKALGQRIFDFSLVLKSVIAVIEKINFFLIAAQRNLNVLNEPRCGHQDENLHLLATYSVNACRLRQP
jgi:hypothetical protein